jgi:hypothetical protein
MKFTDKFILRLDVLQAYYAAVDLNHHVLWLGEGEVSLRHPET